MSKWFHRKYYKTHLRQTFITTQKRSKNALYSLSHPLLYKPKPNLQKPNIQKPNIQKPKKKKKKNFFIFFFI